MQQKSDDNGKAEVVLYEYGVKIKIDKKTRKGPYDNHKYKFGTSS